jgi:hypothetical protein
MAANRAIAAFHAPDRTDAFIGGEGDLFPSDQRPRRPQLPASDQSQAKR